VTGNTPFPPRVICAAVNREMGACAPLDQANTIRAEYEGRPVTEDHDILRAMEPALARVRHLQATPLGVVLDGELARAGVDESPLGNMFADALREQSKADVALNNNSLGGLRADLPAGLLTFGLLYDTFPFDNRLIRLQMTGDLFGQGVANALRRGRRGMFGISGAKVRVSCEGNVPKVEVFRPNGDPIGPDERLVAAGMDSLLGGQMFAPVLPPGSIRVPPDAPIVREVVEDWLRERAGHLRTERWTAPDSRRVEYVGPTMPCVAQ
jgi:hypothetical protein